MTRSSSHDSAADPPSTARSWRWLPRVLLESVLIAFSVLFALGMDEWRTERARAEQASVALRSIRAEVARNLMSVRRARANHLAMRDSLRHYVALGQNPPPEIYLRGIFNPAATQAIAWESARDVGSTNDLPYALVLEVARAYDRQAGYRSLGDALVQDLMMQVRREGFEPVLRDRSASFMSLQEDFANRESELIRHYGGALELIDSLAQSS
jgi:hypothetical protein